jgi:hypothetical protein
MLAFFTYIYKKRMIGLFLRFMYTSNERNLFCGFFFSLQQHNARSPTHFESKDVYRISVELDYQQ